MTEQEIIARLKSEVEAETPDIMDDLLTECGFREESLPAKCGFRKETATTAKLESGRVYKWWWAFGLAAAAAILLLFAAGNVLTGQTPTVPKAEAPTAAVPKAEASTEVVPTADAPTLEAPTVGNPADVELTAVAMVGIDVNPSFELLVDGEDRVILCAAVNAEAEEILGQVDLTDMDVTESSHALVNVMVEKGFLTESANSILLSVRTDEVEKGQRLEERLAQDLNAFLKDAHVGAAVVGQYFARDAEIEEYAGRNGISFGKASVVKRLLTLRGTLREEDLRKLSTQELLLLWTELEAASAQEEPVADRNYTVYGDVSKSDYIAAEEATSIALAHIGLAEVAASSVEFDCFRGAIVYEVEFVADGVEFEGKVHATTGEVLEVETEPAESHGNDDDDDDDFEDDDDDDDDDDFEDED